MMLFNLSTCDLLAINGRLAQNPEKGGDHLKDTAAMVLTSRGEITSETNVPNQ